MTQDSPRQVPARSCVISLGVDAHPPKDHPALVRNFAGHMARLKTSLNVHRFNGDFVGWDGKYPEGCPIHTESPFAFKPFCFLEAKRKGYAIALWMDASIELKRPIDALIETIDEAGYLFFRNFHTVGEYCKDGALAPLGITREESFQMQSCIGGVIGLKFAAPRVAEFLRRWRALAVDGVTFPGPKWSGVRGWPRTASQDSRVSGHRHEQTAASILAYQLGMRSWETFRTFNTFFSINRRITYKQPDAPSTPAPL